MTDPHDPTREVQSFKTGVVGFYVACTIVGVAAAVAAMTWIVFPDAPAARTIGVIAIVVTVLAGIASWYYLAVSRRER